MNEAIQMVISNAWSEFRHAANINIHYLPVYHERFLTLGNTLVAPAQKAMTSVIDVIVIAMPLVLNLVFFVY
jgi:phosphoribulokinase